MLRRCLTAAIVLAAAGLLAAAEVGAQATQGATGTLQGFTPNRDKPVTVRAVTLEVRDKDKMATFTGDVHVVQGDMNLRCKVLVVYYEGEAGQSAPPPQDGGGQQQQIKRMLAKGGVVVTQKDQVATGDNGDFDMRANKGTLTGNVVLTQGASVIRGGKELTVDMTTGVYTVIAAPGRPLEMSIDSSKKGGGDDSKAAGPTSLLPQQASPAPPRSGRKN